MNIRASRLGAAEAWRVGSGRIGRCGARRSGTRGPDPVVPDPIEPLVPFMPPGEADGAPLPAAPPVAPAAPPDPPAEPPAPPLPPPDCAIAAPLAIKVAAMTAKIEFRSSMLFLRLPLSGVNMCRAERLQRNIASPRNASAFMTRPRYLDPLCWINALRIARCKLKLWDVNSPKRFETSGSELPRPGRPTVLRSTARRGRAVHCSRERSSVIASVRS